MMYSKALWKDVAVRLATLYREEKKGVIALMIASLFVSLLFLCGE